MNEVQVEQKSYQMPPQDGFTVAHFLTVTDILNIRVADIHACYELWRS